MKEQELLKGLKLKDLQRIETMRKIILERGYYGRLKEYLLSQKVVSALKEFY